MIRLAGWLVLFVQLIPAGTAPETPGDIFRTANEQYKNEDYEGAYAHYVYLADSLKIVNPALYFNAGNSAFRTGRTGKAVVYYERARRLAPRDPDILATLQYVRFQIRDKINAPRPFIFKRWAWELAGSFNTAELVGITESAYLLLVLLAGILLVRRRWWVRLKPLVICTGAVFLVSVIMFSGRLYNTRFNRQAVIVSPKVDVYSGPAAKYTLRFILHEGTRVRTVKTQEGWYLVELANGEKGWIPSESLDTI